MDNYCLGRWSCCRSILGHDPADNKRQPESIQGVARVTRLTFKNENQPDVRTGRYSRACHFRFLPDRTTIVILLACHHASIIENGMKSYALEMKTELPTFLYVFQIERMWV